MHAFVAQAVGFLAMMFCIASYQIKDSRLLILCKMLGDMIYVIHYLMLGAYSGCVTLAICAVSGLLSSFRGRCGWADWKGWKWMFSILLVIACLITWSKSFRLVPCTCAMISIVSVILTTWSGSARKIRIGKLFVAGPAWLLYCIFVGSYSGILCELFGMSSSAISIIRYDLKKKKRPA